MVALALLLFTDFMKKSYGSKKCGCCGGCGKDKPRQGQGGGGGVNTKTLGDLDVKDVAEQKLRSSR